MKMATTGHEGTLFSLKLPQPAYAPEGGDGGGGAGAPGGEGAGAGAGAGGGDGGNGAGAPGGEGAGGGAPGGGGAGNGAGGANVDTLFDGFSDEMKNWAINKGFTKPADFATAAMSAEKMLGGKTLPAPDPSNPEKLAEWEGWKALGVPEAADGYKVERPQLAEGIEWDEAAEGMFRELAHKHHFTPGQFQAAVELYANLVSQQSGQALAQAAAKWEDVKGELVREWGPAEFQKRVDVAREAIRHYARDERGKPLVDEAVVQRINMALGDAGTIRFFADIGMQLAEQRIIGGSTGIQFGMTPQQAVAKAEEKRRDAEFMKAYNDKSHPGHKGAVAEMLRLNQIAAGETAA